MKTGNKYLYSLLTRLSLKFIIVLVEKVDKTPENNF